ncbi:unnamed protein product [Brachionus calyciflorus]|uniref:Uncharacterized protein n=1 Tax=Brachionus calyciflorus TaxID=104777 RepID=A0A813Z6H3_9BILA|nr:unnamed protein product [Brachionus calyciflorus]
MSNFKRNPFAVKRSEYRHNYLPFDYYDFWITAKENENLRFKNKLRDYLHTPFDWDEDQEYYIEQNLHSEQANQGTQTTDRPNRHDHLKLSSKSENNLAKAPKKILKNSENKQNVKSASVQVNIQKTSKSKRAVSAVQSTPKQKIKFNDSKKESNLLKSKKFTASLSSMAVQTPIEWRLRDHKNIRPTSSSKTLARSSSVVSFQPKRPPFANYGWATKTKDMSVKPTHNALANKILANNFNDEDAILELTLQKLKKDASSIANEYSAIESHVANRFNNLRSDSRSWNSEYDENYPDYSKSGYKKDLYFHTNPNRLTKSSLISNISNPLKRGSRDIIRGKLTTDKTDAKIAEEFNAELSRAIKIFQKKDKYLNLANEEAISLKSRIQLGYFSLQYKAEIS